MQAELLTKFRTLFMILLLVCMLHCINQEESRNDNRSAYPIQESTNDGIKIIINPDFPRDGIQYYQANDIVILGSEEGPEEGMLILPYDIKIDSQDQIYILDGYDACLRVYDPNGNWIRNIGRAGQGPGEFVYLISFDISRDDNLYLLDLMQKRVSIFNTSGKFISSFKVEGHCDRLELDESRQIYLEQDINVTQKSISGSGLWEKIIYRVDSRGEGYFKYGKFPAEYYVWGPRKTAQGRRSITHLSSEAYTTVWKVRGDGLLYLGYSQDYILTIYNKRGKPLFKFGRDFPQIRHPEYSKDLSHPKFYPAFYYRYMFFDDDNNLWLKQYISQPDTKHVYDIFSPEGIFIRQAVVPESIYLYRRGKVYTIIRLERRVYEAKCYRLEELEN